ncbi:redoxin family protein [Paludibacter sp.]|uniref:TlpA family protein disulfide reductase n=1 Tax=Paludibacter sp. TaxID=1898105 RepID=UPI0013547F9A|nr:redoxin family protein [Paludibacter sp.]MTK52381.1 redoxin family protein [Paludibacter sp.]
MKTPAIIFLSLIVCLSCAAQNPAIKKAQLFLNQKTIGYDCFHITTEGHATTDKDTLFIKQYEKYAFMKNSVDTLTGYNFIAKDSLMHPTFHVIVQPWYCYDGNFFHLKTKTPSDTTYSKSEINSNAKEIIQAVIQGQLPAILQMLQSEHLQALSDTLINREPCFQFTLTEEKTPKFLCLSKKTFLPVMTKIIINPTQPFIQEYYYSNFVTGIKLDASDFTENTKHSKTTKKVGLGDTLPSFQFKYLEGKHIQMTSSKKIKVIYLSMIRCGYCLQALPHVESVYNKLKSRQDVNFFVCYPLDSKEQLKKYALTKKIKIPIVYSAGEEKNEKLKSKIATTLSLTMPSVLFLNSDNKIVDIVSGFSNRFEDLIYTKLSALTKK